MANEENIIRELLENIAKEQRYYNYDVTVSLLSSEDANFTSHVYSATISSPSKADLKLFIKRAALSKAFRENGLNHFFDSEYKLYTDIARTYAKIEDKHNVRGEKRMIFPKFYGCSMNFLEETLVLEDLTASNFISHDRLKPVDWEYASKAVEELAKLHALSLAYNQEYPAQYQKTLKDFQYVLSIKKEKYEVVWAKSFSTALEFTRDDNKEKLRKFEKNQGGVDMIERYNNPYRCPVIAHGDYKTSNLMHRVDDEGKIDIAVLDYQTLRTSSMPSDLVYFIFASTDQRFRKRHMTQLVDHYYDSLRTAMRLRGVNIDDVYPREDFDYEMKTVLPYGLAVTILILSIVLVEEAPAVDLNLSVQDMAMKPGELYRDRLNGILDDFVEWGVL